jgi:hypothetical protein
LIVRWNERDRTTGAVSRRDDDAAHVMPRSGEGIPGRSGPAGLRLR